MVVVRVPSLVADQAGGQRDFEVEGATLGEVLQALPIADLLLDEHGELRRLVNVYLDGEDARRGAGLETRLDGVQEVRVIAAVAGGQVPHPSDITGRGTRAPSEPGSRRSGCVP